MKKILFTLSLLVIFTNCSGEETTNETSATQDTTTTTILVNVNIDPAKYCQENPDNEQCKGYDSENSEGYSSTQSSGGMSTMIALLF